MMLWMTMASAWAADFTIACVEGCVEKLDDRTPRLLALPDAPTDITLRWRTPELPMDGEKWTVHLRAGNAQEGTLSELGQLAFQDVNGRLEATHTVTADQLGQGTFLTVLIGKSRNKQQILDWRAFRLLREAERDREVDGVQPSSNWDIDLAPAVMRADTPRGALPRGGGDRAAWWSLVDVQTAANLDLDGNATGLPGLSITVDNVWEAGTDANWRDKIRDKIRGVDGHTVRFEDLEFVEHRPTPYDRPAADGSKLEVRYFYAAVTLVTSADIRRFQAKDLVRKKSGERVFFSHETGASFREPEDPRLWSSYDEREHSQDIELLALLQDAVRDGAAIPGLPAIDTADGDGGDSVFHVGFVASVAPQPSTDTGEPVRPTVLAADVVARRSGVGAIRTAGSASEGQSWLSRWLQGEEGIDLDDPPRGWRAVSALAQPATLTGSLPLVGDPDFAQRDDSHDGMISAIWEPTLGAASRNPEAGARRDMGLRDTRARFALSAKLRAGALVNEKSIAGFKRPIDIVPINAYTQYILRMAVAIPTTAQVAASPDGSITSTEHAGSDTNIDEREGFLVRLFGQWGGLVAVLAGGVILIVLLLLLPGVRTFINRLFRVLAPRVRREE